MDAMWRTLGLQKLNNLIYIKLTFFSVGYQTYPSPNPTVRTIKVKTESEINKIIQDGHICDLLIYFHRSPLHHNLTFSAYFQCFMYGYILPLTLRNCEPNNNENYYTILRLPHISRNIYVYKRNAKNNSITRLEMVPLTVGEKWYLRLILYSEPVLSFKDARTVDGSLFQTFQEAALARKLVEDENEAIIAFQWATLHSTPPQLRTLFAIMTAQGFPTVKLYNDPQIRVKLLEDYLLDFDDNMRYI
jgi:hypothetical protein